jgi:hypothetical protein
MRSYFLTPVSETKLTKTDEVHEAIRGLKVSKDRGPNGIQNRALKRLPKRALPILVQVFNAVGRTSHFTIRASDLHP